MLFLKASRIVKNVFNHHGRRLQASNIQLVFGCNQLFVLLLQLRVANQGFVNLPLFLLRSLVVKEPDQIVLGKSLYHRQYGFLSFSF
jgi:hypothetical protein